eukprot:TRINITY_DN287_c0_g2_i3.p1 TRINITY_DN287_c0_g2~~TRINITY_DN287_c0_g2_i3.p1  ORF type:complete len:508 (+),score=96.19 TRINITY_DN287_c0_g2_i3:64-1587(+)
MEMIDYSQEIENSSPLPLTITHDYDDSEKICVGSPDMYHKENHHSNNNTTPTHPTGYSDSDKGNLSPLTQESQSPPGGQDLDSGNGGYSDGEFPGELNIETPGKRRLKEWLVEQINSGKYEGLKWLTEEKTLFSVPWKHAREKTYCMDKDAALYKEWASYSGKHRKSEANPINWKLNFRCALYSVRGIKERKDVYMRGHRVYELTDNSGELPSKEYPQVPTQIPGFPKSTTETPDELSSCVYDDSAHPLPGDLTPHYLTNSQPLIHGASQSESVSSQKSVTTKLNNLNAFDNSQGDIPPSSPSRSNKSFLVMPGAVGSSHLSPITPIPYDATNSKLNSFSPSTPGLHRPEHELQAISVMLSKKKLQPTTPYSFPKLTNGQNMELTHPNFKPLSSPVITSPAYPFHSISLVAMPNTPTLPYPIQTCPIKASPIPYQLKSDVTQHYIRPDLLSLNTNSLKQNLSLHNFLRQEVHNSTNESPELEITHSQNARECKRSLTSSCENLTQLG